MLFFPPFIFKCSNPLLPPQFHIQREGIYTVTFWDCPLPPVSLHTLSQSMAAFINLPKNIKVPCWEIRHHLVITTCCLVLQLPVYLSHSPLLTSLSAKMCLLHHIVLNTCKVDEQVCLGHGRRDHRRWTDTLHVTQLSNKYRTSPVYFVHQIPLEQFKKCSFCSGWIMSPLRNRNWSSAWNKF